MSFTSEQISFKQLAATAQWEQIQDCKFHFLQWTTFLQVWGSKWCTCDHNASTWYVAQQPICNKVPLTLNWSSSVSIVGGFSVYLSCSVHDRFMRLETQHNTSSEKAEMIKAWDNSGLNTDAQSVYKTLFFATMLLSFFRGACRRVHRVLFAVLRDSICLSRSDATLFILFTFIIIFFPHTLMHLLHLFWPKCWFSGQEGYCRQSLQENSSITSVPSKWRLHFKDK